MGMVLREQMNDFVNLLQWKNCESRERFRMLGVNDFKNL